MSGLVKVLALCCALYVPLAPCFAGAPIWPLKNVPKNASYSKQIRVVAVDRDGPAEIAAINTGSERRLQIGAPCLVRKGDLERARAVVVEANAGRAVVLVLSGGNVEPGDEVDILLAK